MNFALLRNSLRMRLLAGTLVWIVISILVAGWGLGQLFYQHVEARFDAELNNHLDQLTAQLILDEQNQAQVRLLPSDPRLNKPLSGLYWQIDRISATGEHPVKVVLRSRSLWDETLAVPPDAQAGGELRDQVGEEIVGAAEKVAASVRDLLDRAGVPAHAGREQSSECFDGSMIVEGPVGAREL